METNPAIVDRFKKSGWICLILAAAFGVMTWIGCFLEIPLSAEAARLAG